MSTNTMQYERRRRNVKRYRSSNSSITDRRKPLKEMPSVIDSLVEYNNVRLHNKFLIDRCNKTIDRLSIK